MSLLDLWSKTGLPASLLKAAIFAAVAVVLIMILLIGRKRGNFGPVKKRISSGDTQVTNEQIDDALNDMLNKTKRHYNENRSQKQIKAERQKKEVRHVKSMAARVKMLQIPKTAQDSIPYYAVYEQDGIIETSKGVFTKSYLLGDVNYKIAKQEDQEDMFSKYCELLNSFEPTMRFEITCNQKNIHMKDFEADNMLPMRNDGLDDLRIEQNDILRRKIMEGKNDLVIEKYLTVSLPAVSVEAAQIVFLRLDTEITQNVNRIGQATCTPLTTAQRLEILHDIYNIGSEGTFGNNVVKVEDPEDGTITYQFAEEKFRFDIMRAMGMTSKDMIAPSDFCFKSDYGMIGDKYFRALYLRTLPEWLHDNCIAELTKTNFNMLLSMNYEPVDPERAQKLVRAHTINVNANMVDKQKQASRAGYSTDLISPDLKDAAAYADEIRKDLNSRNQKLFMMTMCIVHFADSKEQLDQDTKTIQSTGRRLVMSINKLTAQQENGLATALPLAVNKLSIKRSLTSESSAVFMPFVNKELNDSGGMYYGNNAVSHNLIRLNRRLKKNGNGFIFGTPGSGKSMSAKQEMLETYLSSNDDVIVIDPEGEYYPMVELMGGEVIRIAAGGDTYINPFDIDMHLDKDETDDPITIKCDFIVSMCDTVLGGNYGLTPTQRSILDRCVHKIYEPFLASFDPDTHEYNYDLIPTMVEFYNALREQTGYDAMQLADGLEIYVTGSLNIFAHKTNVQYSKRFVVYDIKDIGTQMKTMGLLVVLDNIWNRIVAGRKQGRYDMLERITNALRSGSELTAENRCEFADFLKQLSSKLHKKDRTGEKLTGKSDIISLSHWLNINHRDVDVIVVDNDAAEWSTPAICSLTDEDKKNGIQYEPREDWLLTLPVDHVLHEDYSDTVVLNAPLSHGQMCFLFDYMPEETISAKEQELLSRASHTDADFSQRLAYLQTGTAFETRFDGNCMDVEDVQDRLLLCSFLADHSHVYISSFPDDPEVSYPYALERDKSGQLHIVDMPDLCTIKRTEPGKGLLSTLDGRVYYAEHAARAARESILQPDLNLSSSQERS